MSVVVLVTGGCDPAPVSVSSSTPAEIPAATVAESIPQPKAIDATVDAPLDQPTNAWGELISVVPSEFPDDDAIRVLAWNIESEGANADTIADQIMALPRYDIYGFSEVRPQDFATIRDRLGNDYACRYSKSGYNDRLAYAIRKDRFQIVNQYELKEFESHTLNPGNYRSPYITEVKDIKTGRELTLVLNHLARGKAEIRQAQAAGLSAWAASLGDTPLIAIGDYNFDYVFATDKGNDAFDVFLKNDVVKWVRPTPMVDSNWFDGNGDGVDDYPGSLLDFVFVGGEAKTWKSECRVLVREGDFPDDKITSDHRPVEFTILPQAN
ncbi:Endonuclease/Exonuclease/phosphatase family protein [Rubripirellula reticaptiva]|uniref:Endonuclease/Exonuclease/phosphatase family protein n=2 Tax=Rubripirellula reticaptiva TaxID=2528013 RepID=A0A5C6ET34_9BACT|nr:Endonuclease/Exonuclease/phosphatase family protein [Rubripirellula reticaptiva]